MSRKRIERKRTSNDEDEDEDDDAGRRLFVFGLHVTGAVRRQCLYDHVAFTRSHERISMHNGMSNSCTTIASTCIQDEQHCNRWRY
jgi:hypothetical protein